MVAALPLDKGSERRMGHRPSDVADKSCIGDTPLRPRRGRGIVRAGSRGFAVVEVGADGQVAVGGEIPRDLLGGLVIARHVVDHHDATHGRAIQWLGQIRLDRITAVTGDLDRLRPHRIAHRRAAPVLLPGGGFAASGGPEGCGLTIGNSV